MPTGTLTGLDIRLISTAFGAEIRGVDIAAPIDDQTIAEIRRAWLTHQVIFFPDQHIGPDEQIAFARRFGEITAPSAVLPSIDDDHKEVVAFDSRDFKEEYQKSGKHHGWHVDITFQATPPAGSVFNVVKLPPVGGATLFASAQASYDSLSRPIQQLLDGLVAVHNFGYIGALTPKPNSPGDWEGQRVDGNQVEHPVVAVHPETGRKGLFVNPGFTRYIKGLSAHESDVLLDFLYDHTLQPEHVIHYRWEEGGVGFWDNRAIWHRRADDFDPGEIRVVHRVQLRGGIPVGPPAAGSG